MYCINAKATISDSLLLYLAGQFTNEKHLILEFSQIYVERRWPTFKNLSIYHQMYQFWIAGKQYYLSSAMLFQHYRLYFSIFQCMHAQHPFGISTWHRVTGLQLELVFFLIMNYVKKYGAEKISMPASVCVCVLLPNLHQRCKTDWLRSLLFCGAIDFDLQCQIELKISIYTIWRLFTP